MPSPRLYKENWGSYELQRLLNLYVDVLPGEPLMPLSTVLHEWAEFKQAQKGTAESQSGFTRDDRDHMERIEALVERVLVNLKGAGEVLVVDALLDMTRSERDRPVMPDDGC